MTPRRKQILLLTAALLLGVLAWGFCALPPDAFWITDGGNKFLVMKEFLRSGRVSFPVEAFFPDGGFHFLEYHGRMYSIFPEYFPVLAAGFYRCFGSWGLYLPSAAGTLLTLFFAWKMLEELKVQDEYFWLIPLLFAGTPLVFYTLTFWEMTLGCAAAAGALWLVLRGSFAWAGLVLGCGLIFREEMYFVVAALAAALAGEGRWRALLRLLGGFACGGLPVWSYQLIAYGHLLGLHGSLYYRHNANSFDPLRQLRGYWTYLVEFPWAEWLAAALAGALAARFAGRRWKLAALAGAGAVALCGCRSLWLESEPVWFSGMSVGFFGMLPWAYCLFFADWRGRRGMILFTVSYLIAVPVLLTQSDLGIIWGPRHFLVMLPAALFLAYDAAVKTRLRRAFVLLALLAVAYEVRGLQTLYTAKNQTARLTTWLGARLEPAVVTDLFFLPMQTPELAEKHRFYFVKRGADLERVEEELRRRGVNRFSIVCSPHAGFRKWDNPSIARFLQRVRIERPPEQLRLPGASLWDVVLLNAEWRQRAMRPTSSR